MTRETAAINAGRNGNAAAGRPVLPEGPYWDLDLLTPDDVCALLKVKKKLALRRRGERRTRGHPARQATPVPPISAHPLPRLKSK